MHITQELAAKSGTWYQPKEIERKLHNGDAISDDELSQATKFYHHLAEVLGCLGPQWHFAFNEANRLFTMCRRFENARRDL